jgi:anti-anti-sigma factor
MTIADAGDAITVVRLDGDIDLSRAAAIGDQLEELVNSGLESVVVMCDAVSFVESRGLAMMARVQRLAEEAGCRLSWRNLQLPVLRTIHNTGLDTYLRIEA